jgi:hypothetical protein
LIIERYGKNCAALWANPDTGLLVTFLCPGNLKKPPAQQHTGKQQDPEFIPFKLEACQTNSGAYINP